jgi:rod shape-determining protein MreD
MHAHASTGAGMPHPYAAAKPRWAIVRWLLVAILGYACLVLQTAAFRPGALAVPINGYWTRPDLALVVGLFLALYLEPYEVFVVGWCLGLASDVVSVSGPLGLQALVMSLLLLAVSHARGAVNRTRILTQFLLALALVAAAHLVWYLATRYLQGIPLAFLQSVEQAVLDAAYSAVLAPYLFWILERLRRPLGVTGESRQG